MHIFTVNSRLILLTLILLSPWSSVAKPSSSQECITLGWPSDHSDLRPDPALIRGVLNNGLRYVVLPNNEPEDRVAMYLNIQAGSLNEAEDQRGVAHFLEHMLFNGTEHYPPGELVKFFQSIGMSFGGDTNAHTSFEETVYKILLPTGDETNLRNGLKVLADFSRGALLLEEEVEKERGIILAEKISRDSASYRAYEAKNSFIMEGTLLPHRMVIGEEKVVQEADRQLLKRYYDQWYRLENMLLVIVGKTSVDSVLPLIDEYFSGQRSAPVDFVCPDIGTVIHKGVQSRYIYEPDLGRTDVSVETVWNTEPQNDSLSYQRVRMLRYASSFMVQKRLQQIIERGEGGFTSGSFFTGEMMARIGYGAISARTEDGEWQRGLSTLITTLNQALMDGFAESELEIFKKEILADLKSAVLRADSRSSQNLAMGIIRQFNDNRVFMSPEQEEEIYGGIVREMTVADVERQFADDWNHGNRLVTVVGNALLDAASAERQIGEVYDTAARVAMGVYRQVDAGEFPYLDIPEGTEDLLKEKQYLADVDTHRYALANNVVVNVKKTDFEPNTIRILVNIGQGRHAEPAPGMALLGEDLVNDSGTGTLTRTALADILAGSTIDIDFRIGEDSFTFSGKAVTGEVGLLLQVLHTLLRDPGFRPQAFDNAMISASLMYERLKNNVEGALRGEVERFLAGGSGKVGLPPWQDVAQVTLEELRGWLEPTLKSGSMEVNIVGDVDLETIEKEILTSLGTLDRRDPIGDARAAATFPVGERLLVEVDSDIPKSVVVSAWLTDDFEDIARTRRLHLLAMVLDERLRQSLREELGATYSPTVYSAPGRLYRDYGRMMVLVTVEPGKEEIVEHEIAVIAKDIVLHGVNVEELEMVKKPLLTSLKDSVSSHEYWLYSVLSGSTRYPDKLLWPASMQRDFASVKAAELTALARRYLEPDTRAVAIVRPRKNGE